MKTVNALSIDIEDYYHAEVFNIGMESWGEYPSRIEVNVEKVIRLLGETKATFFVLGWAAENFKGIVKKLHNAGHEIASHGYAHRLIYKQNRKEFSESVRKSKQILEDITGEEVIGYRAPTFSITRDNLWALDVLMEEGYKYDSSIFPIIHDRYGIPDAERFPFKIERRGMEIIEFPLSTVLFKKVKIPFSPISFKGMNFPISGGGYMRFLPYSLIKSGFSSVNREGKPAVFYFHPWEIDADQPRLEIKLLPSIRHYYNLKKSEEKIGNLLRDFSFTSMKKVLEPYLTKEHSFSAASSL